MNPFQRLKQAIDKVNIQYNFKQQQQIIPQNDQAYEPAKINRDKQVTVTEKNDLKKIRELCETQQIGHIRDINSLTSKIQQLSNALKRAQSSNESYMREIVTLQKQNELLKYNLTAQFASLSQSDDKQRKYKQQIYRINITVNELATQLNSQRTNKKQLQREIQQAKGEMVKKDQQTSANKKQLKTYIQRLTTQLNERVQMYQYNVKKNTQNRMQYKSQIQKQKNNYQKIIQDDRKDNDKVRYDLFQSRKQLQIHTLRKASLLQTYIKLQQQLQQTKQSNIQLLNKVTTLQNNFQLAQKQNQQLQTNLKAVTYQLFEQQKNLKIKIVEIKDESLQLELEMYKKQCKQLMQEKIIMNNLNKSEKSLETNYKIISSQILESK